MLQTATFFLTFIITQTLYLFVALFAPSLALEAGKWELTEGKITNKKTSVFKCRVNMGHYGAGINCLSFNIVTLTTALTLELSSNPGA